MKRIINLEFIPINTDTALLLLRLWLGISLFAQHGIEKFVNYSKWKEHFPDVIHVGSATSLTFALITDGICSLLVLAGVGTRIASLFIVINLFVVFITMHKFSFAGDHAELVYLYLGGYLAIFIAGAGKYSIDQKLISR
jgi:putative oxidoreductase